MRFRKILGLNGGWFSDSFFFRNLLRQGNTNWKLDGKTTTQNLKDKSQMVVAECGGVCRNAMMGFGVGNAEVEGKVVEYTRCRSWKHGP